MQSDNWNCKSMWRVVIQVHNLLHQLELNTDYGSLMLRVKFTAVSKIYIQCTNSERGAKNRWNLMIAWPLHSVWILNWQEKMYPDIRGKTQQNSRSVKYPVYQLMGVHPLPSAGHNIMEICLISYGIIVLVCCFGSRGIAQNSGWQRLYQMDILCLRKQNER